MAEGQYKLADAQPVQGTGKFSLSQVDAPKPDPNHGKYGYEGYKSKLPWPLNKLEEMVSDSTDAMAKGASKTFGKDSTADDRAGGVSQMLHGFFNSAGLPFVLQSGAAAPLKTAVGLGVGIPAQAVGEKVAGAMGAGPGTSALIGDATGAVAGGTAAHGSGSPTIRAATRGAVVEGAKAATSPRTMVGAGTAEYLGSHIGLPHGTGAAVVAIPRIVGAAVRGGKAAVEKLDAQAVEPPAPVSPGEALAKSQGLDYAKLSADERALLDHVAKAQANTAQPQPPIPDPVVRENRTTEIPAQPAGPIPNESNAVAQESPTQPAGPGKSIAQMIQEEVAARKAAAGEPVASPAVAPPAATAPAVTPKAPRPARTGAAYRPGVSYTTSPGGPAGTMPQITADMTRAQMEAAGVPANATAGDIAQAVHASQASPAAPPPAKAPAVAAPAPLPPQEAPPGAAKPPSLAQQEAWMAAKGAPPTEAPQSRVTATGEAKSPQLRAAEITGANRTAKAKRFAETLYGNGDGLSSKDLSDISAGRTSQMQRDAGKPHGWGDIADSIGEKDPSGDTVAEIIHQVREMEKASKKPGPPAAAPSKKPDQMNRAELAKQAGLPADATPQQIMAALQREMEKAK